MEELKKHIFDERNGLHYTLVGDYYIPDLQLQEENLSIGIWKPICQGEITPELYIFLF